jgi:hypothetical protein
MKETTNFPVESLKYIKKYQLIFRKVVKEAKKKRSTDMSCQLKIKIGFVEVNKQEIW